MSGKNEKHMIGDTGYEVKQSMRIGGRDILLAENMSAEDGQFYLVCGYKEDGIFAEYSQAVTNDDYLEAVQEFTGRVNSEVEVIKAEHNALGLPTALFTAEHCHPHDYGQDIVGKVVAIRADVFSPEYRRGDYQLVWVIGGNGAHGSARGNAVFCHHLNSGEHTRFERHDVQGVVKELPGWAQECLARLQGELEKPTEEKEYAGRYEITERIEAGQKVFALGHSPNAPQPYGTWEGYVGRKGSFNYGHYFSAYDDAKADLQERAAFEQQRRDRHRRSDKDGR